MVLDDSMSGEDFLSFFSGRGFRYEYEVYFCPAGGLWNVVHAGLPAAMSAKPSALVRELESLCDIPFDNIRCYRNRGLDFLFQ